MNPRAGSNPGRGESFESVGTLVDRQGQKNLGAAHPAAMRTTAAIGCPHGER